MMFRLYEESNTIEYKVELPNESQKWLKTIVSFSNTSGGSLVIGVEDDTLKVVGINESRSILETKIIDTIFNGITPSPTIDIVVQNIDNKDIFIIKVARGGATPYYLNSQGVDLGTYMRFGSTDRIATESQILELTKSRDKKNFTNELFKKDHMTRELTEKDILDFIEGINKRNSKQEIHTNKLIEWELIKNNFGKHLATNGYMLLTNKPFYYSYVKIGVFDGVDKSNFIHEEVVEGSIIEQYNTALDLLLEILNKGYTFKKIRKKIYQIPEEVIREILANAIVHRDYLDEHPIRIEIYKDRIQFFSPGALFGGVKLTDILSGTSKLRNKNIAEVFHHLGYIEKWGSGIQRSNKILKDNHMNFLEIDTESIHGITVTIRFEKEYLVEEHYQEGKLKPTKENILKYYQNKDGSFTRRAIEKDFSLSEYYARTICEDLVKEGLVLKVGKGPATHYVIV